YSGLVLLFSCIGVASLLVSYRLLVRHTGAEPLALGLTVLAAFISIPLWSVRPLTFSLLLTALFLSFAWDYKRRKRDCLWLLPPLMALWANLHAGYVVGLALVGLLTLAEGVEAWRFRDNWWRPGHAAVIAVLCFLASGINPYTYRLWLYPLTYFFGDNA